MKRKIAIGLCLLMAGTLVFAGCGNSGQQATTAGASEAAETTAAAPETTAEIETTVQETEEETAGEETAMAGGWSVNTETKAILSEEESALFTQATEGLLGVDYEPVAVVASQVVAGENFAYLCKGTPVVPDAEAAWYIVVIYKDLDGNAQISSIESIDVSALSTKENVDNADFMGSWEAKIPEEGQTGLPENAQKAIDAAKANYVGVDYVPIALLATQVVAGTNYKFLCAGSMVLAEPVTSLYIVDVYEDLEGKAEITDAQVFVLEDYIYLSEEDDEDLEAPEEGEVAAGGWSLADEPVKSLSAEEKEYFNQAMSQVMGVDYFPVTVLATQVVAGKNYAYFCRGTTVIPEPVPQWYVVTVYVNPEGEAECSGIEEFNVTDIKTTEANGGEAVGAWEIAPPAKDTEALSEDVAAVFDSMIQEEKDITYSPIALLATQLVAGMNYKILCYGESGGDAPAGLYVLTGYEDLDGNVSLTEAQQVDITAYAGAK